MTSDFSHLTIAAVLLAVVVVTLNAYIGPRHIVEGFSRKNRGKKIIAHMPLETLLRFQKGPKTAPIEINASPPVIKPAEGSPCADYATQRFTGAIENGACVKNGCLDPHTLFDAPTASCKPQGYCNHMKYDAALKKCISAGSETTPPGPETTPPGPETTPPGPPADGTPCTDGDKKGIKNGYYCTITGCIDPDRLLDSLTYQCKPKGYCAKDTVYDNDRKRCVSTKPDKSKCTEFEADGFSGEITEGVCRKNGCLNSDLYFDSRLQACAKEDMPCHSKDVDASKGLAGKYKWIKNTFYNTNQTGPYKYGEFTCELDGCLPGYEKISTANYYFFCQKPCGVNNGRSCLLPAPPGPDGACKMQIKDGNVSSFTGKCLAECLNYAYINDDATACVWDNWNDSCTAPSQIFYNGKCIARPTPTITVVSASSDSVSFNINEDYGMKDIDHTVHVRVVKRGPGSAGAAPAAAWESEVDTKAPLNVMTATGLEADTEYAIEASVRVVIRGGGSKDISKSEKTFNTCQSSVKNGKFVKDFFWQSNTCELVCDEGYRNHTSISKGCMKTKTYRMKLVEYPKSRYQFDRDGLFETRHIFILTADDKGNSLTKKMDINVYKSQYNNSDFMAVSHGYQDYVGYAIGISGTFWYNIIIWSKDDVKPGDTLFTYVVPEDSVIKGFQISFGTDNNPQVKVTLDRGAGEKVVFDNGVPFEGGNMIFASE